MIGSEILEVITHHYWDGLVQQGHSLPPLYSLADGLTIQAQEEKGLFRLYKNFEGKSLFQYMPSSINPLTPIKENFTYKIKPISLLSIEIMTPRLLIRNIHPAGLKNPNNLCYEFGKEESELLLKFKESPFKNLLWDGVHFPVARDFESYDLVTGENITSVDIGPVHNEAVGFSWGTKDKFQGKLFGFETVNWILETYLTEAVKSSMNCRKAVAGIFKYNIASRKLAEKLGFKTKNNGNDDFIGIYDYARKLP